MESMKSVILNANYKNYYLICLLNRIKISQLNGNHK